LYSRFTVRLVVVEKSLDAPDDGGSLIYRFFLQQQKAHKRRKAHCAYSRAMDSSVENGLTVRRNAADCYAKKYPSLSPAEGHAPKS
jgi:hypothetical protein